MVPPLDSTGVHPLLKIDFRDVGELNSEAVVYVPRNGFSAQFIEEAKQGHLQLGLRREWHW